MSLDGDSRPRRATSGSVAATREAKLAISDVVRALEPLRNRAALIAARARHGDVDRKSLATDCELIAAEVGQMRAALILRLMDAPRAVAGHSRVLDVEKSLDSLERQLDEARRALSRQ